MTYEEQLKAIEDQYAEQEAIFAELNTALASVGEVEFEVANEKLEAIEQLARTAPKWPFTRPF
jgi:uncharacterized coiled-coil protein SlyX